MGDVTPDTPKPKYTPIGAGGPVTPAFDGGRPASTPFTTNELVDAGLLWAINRLEADVRRLTVEREQWQRQVHIIAAERDEAVASARAAWAALNSIRSAALADVGCERLCERVLDESAAALNAQGPS